MTNDELIIEARRKLSCLYMECPEAVVDDVSAACEAAFKALLSDSDECARLRKALETIKAIKCGCSSDDNSPAFNAARLTAREALKK